MMDINVRPLSMLRHGELLHAATEVCSQIVSGQLLKDKHVFNCFKTVTVEIHMKIMKPVRHHPQ